MTTNLLDGFRNMSPDGNLDFAEKLKQSAAHNKLSLLQGYEGAWIKARRDNCHYISNKVISICIAFTFAAITLSFKKITYQYRLYEGDDEDNKAYHFMLIYWLLFIYLSLTGMDEMIELFSVINQLEKGALGLFFEMNYFVGVILAFYITWFNFTYDAPKYVFKDDKNPTAREQELEGNFNNMYNWLYLHYVYLYISILVSMVVFFMYKKMDFKAVGKTKEREAEKAPQNKSNDNELM